MLRLHLLLAWLLTASFSLAGPLKLERFDGPSPTFQDNSGTVEMSGPISVRATPTTAPTATDQVIEFEYFCVGGVPTFAALPGPPFEAKTARYLPALGHSETWSTYTARLAPAGKPLPAGWRQLRFDFPLPANRVLQIRNAQLRSERPGEFSIAIAKPAASAPQAALDAYLGKTFPTAFTKVAVTDREIRIQGNVGKEAGPFFLADIPMDVVLDDPRSWQTLIPLSASADGIFRLDLPRTRQRDGRPYDRLTSRWQIVRKVADVCEPLSHAHYAEWVQSRAPNLPPAAPKNKKGLGGWSLGKLPNELDDLGVSAVTVNLKIDPIVSLTSKPGATPTTWQGRSYYINEKALAGYDSTLRGAMKRNIMVSGILLIGNPAKSGNEVVKLMGHPDAVKDGIFAMPNVTSEEGIALYGAVLNFLAERWSRPDGKYGRMHHWIIHNEVDAGWVWTNAGDKPALVYMDLYQRSMRLMWLIAAQYDPHSRPFITLTHHWAWPGSAHWYGSKLMIELLVKFCDAEGDFPWAVAYHPYPQSLLKPRTWEDEQATFSFDSKKITPKNLEVLDAYMKLPQMQYQGKVRPVHLSENGFNSPDYSAKSLEDQAAGMALAWKKIQALSSIESWQYHNWIDNRAEGGLKIGLRKFPDDATDPLGKKPIWFLYQALGTPREDEVCAPYLKTIGIQSWDEVLHKEPVH